VGVEHVDLLVEHIVDRDGDVGPEGCGLLEPVLEVKEDGVLPEGRSVTLGTVTMNAASWSRTPV
jgi:hypothetical protein